MRLARSVAEFFSSAFKKVSSAVRRKQGRGVYNNPGEMYTSILHIITIPDSWKEKQMRIELEKRRDEGRLNLRKKNNDLILLFKRKTHKRRSPVCFSSLTFQPIHASHDCEIKIVQSNKRRIQLSVKQALWCIKITLINWIWDTAIRLANIHVKHSNRVHQ